MALLVYAVCRTWTTKEKIQLTLAPTGMIKKVAHNILKRKLDLTYGKFNSWYTDRKKAIEIGCCRHHSIKWVVEKVLYFPHIVLNINITIRKIRKFNIYYIKSKFNQVKNVEVMTKSHNKCCVLGDEDWENG